MTIMTKITKRLVATLLVLFMFGGVSLFAGGAREAVPAENIVRIALSVEPGSLDMHADTTTASLDVGQAIYEQLVRFDEDMNIQPWLAERYEQLDEVTYRFYLRQGIQFHSGNPFNAEAVKAHIDRMIDPDDPGLAKAYMNWMKEAVVVDEYTVDVIASSPYGPAMAFMALPFNVIHDAKQAEVEGDLFGVRPSGTGPFKFVDWERGSHITLAANEDYWGGKPAVDGVQFRIIPEAGTRTMSLQAGEVHITTQLAPEGIQTLQRDPNSMLIIEGEPRYIRWQINLKHPFLSDINVRRALTHAIDYPMIIGAILEEYGAPLHGYGVPGQIGFLELPYEYNPGEADRLLSQSGWSKNSRGIYQKNGEELFLEIITGDKMARELELFEAMQSEFGEFGIAIGIKLIEGAQIYPEIVRYMTAWVNERKDPDYALLTMDGGARTGEMNVALENAFKTDAIRNSTTYANPAFDAAMEIAVSGAPLEERIEAYHEAQRYLHEDLPAIHLWMPSWAVATAQNITGFSLHPAGVWYYQDLRFID